MYRPPWVEGVNGFTSCTVVSSRAMLRAGRGGVGTRGQARPSLRGECSRKLLYFFGSEAGAE